MNLINGRILAEKIKDKIAPCIKEMCDDKNKRRPNLAIILVGDRDDSKLYVSLKEKEGRRVGIDTSLYLFSDKVSEKKLIETINFLNQDIETDAILVQLPLPKNLNTDKIINTIDLNKDVDGFTLENLKKIESSLFNIPPVFGAIIEILNSINFDFKSKKEALIIANSEIFGLNLVKFLKQKNLQSQWIEPNDSELILKTKKADILITMCGKPELIKADGIKNDVIIIDAGIIKIDNKIKGDVDFNSVKDKIKFITPVPGGVGPLTIACLLKNVLDFYNQNLHKYLIEITKNIKY